MIEHAQQHHSGNARFFVEADVTALQYESEFDLCVSFNALHWVPLHLHGQMLAGVRRALRPGGRAFLQFEAANSMQDLLEVFQDTVNRWSLDVTPASDLARPSAEHYAELLA